MACIGNYRIIQQLGRGGFAEVYLGEHVRLGTQVAIKVLSPSLAPANVKQFLNEARIIAQLRHPHILGVLDFDIQQEKAFLVLDYAPGGTLARQHPRGQRVSVIQVVSYVNQIASALQYAHDHGIIHRDVKPANILLDARGQLLLSDFGIAILARSTLSQSTQEMVGTLTYMAPEQIQGKPRPSSDQYALGIVVYELLTGWPPFLGSAPEVVAQHLGVDPAPLHLLSPSVEQMVLKALAKDPKARFPSVAAFAQALERAATEDTDTHTHNMIEPTQLARRSHFKGTTIVSAMQHLSPQVKPHSSSFRFWQGFLLFLLLASLSSSLLTALTVGIPPIDFDAERILRLRLQQGMVLEQEGIILSLKEKDTDFPFARVESLFFKDDKLTISITLKRQRVEHSRTNFQYSTLLTPEGELSASGERLSLPFTHDIASGLLWFPVSPHAGESYVFRLRVLVTAPLNNILVEYKSLRLNFLFF